MDTLTSPANIASLLQWGQRQCPDSDSAGLDCRVILAHCLRQSQTYLMTWPERMVAQDVCLEFERMIALRRKGHPVAHIVGHRGFWTLDLAVNASTLIPRPETELLVEEALQLPLPKQARVLDLGTGTGAIALALASEKPAWTVIGVDIQREAVELAQKNAANLRLSNVTFAQSNWFSNVQLPKFDLIISNPPYVEQDSPYLRQGDVRFEPLSALTAGIDGLDDIKFISKTACEYLLDNGWIMFEHGYTQSASVGNILYLNGFDNVTSKNDLNNLPRLTFGRNNN